MKAARPVDVVLHFCQNKSAIKGLMEKIEEHREAVMSCGGV